MIRNTPTLLLLASLLLASCYHEAPVHSELGQPKYEIKDGPDYVSSTIYRIKEETGTQVVYDFKGGDAAWNLGSLLSNKIYIPIDTDDPTDVAMVEPNLRYLEEQVLSKYSADFQKKYFPVRIFLADSLKRNKRVEAFVFTARDHVAINMYKEGDKMTRGSGLSPVNTKEDYLAQFAPQVHSGLWEFIFTYRIDPPNSFYAYSAEVYKKNFGDKTDKTFDIRQAGFWTYDEFNSFGKNYRAVDASTDISDYIFRMTSLSEAEITEAMGGYQMMLDKYHTLRSFIKELTGMDLQEIGNSASQARHAANTPVEN